MMNPFSEMVLLPKEEYARLSSHALQSTVPTMRKELEEIKLKYGDSLPADQKLRLESEVVSKYTNHCKPPTEEITPQMVGTTPAQDKDLIIKQLESFPQSNRTRALQMYQYLQSSASNKWNAKNQLLDSDDNPIMGSNIVDLIDFVTNIRKTQSTPKGLLEFVGIIHDSNMPQRLMSTPGLNKVHKFIDAVKESDVQDQLAYKQETDEDEFATIFKKRKIEKKQQKPIAEDDDDSYNKEDALNWQSLPFK